jgi:hypothetical protein
MICIEESDADLLIIQQIALVTDTILTIASVYDVGENIIHKPIFVFERILIFQTCNIGGVKKVMDVVTGGHRMELGIESTPLGIILEFGIIRNVDLDVVRETC